MNIINLMSPGHIRFLQPPMAEIHVVLEIHLYIIIIVQLQSIPLWPGAADTAPRTKATTIKARIVACFTV